MSTDTKPQWQIDRETERAERAETIRSFANAIGGTAAENDYDGLYEVLAKIEGVDVEFRPDWHKRRWCACTVAPRNPNRHPVQIHGEPAPSVTVAMDRAPDAILADLRRRLVPDALAWLEKANAKADGAAKHEAAIVASMEALRAAAKAAGLKCRESAHQSRTPGNDGTLFINGEAVRVSANWYQIERPTWDRAESVVSAIASLRKL